MSPTPHRAPAAIERLEARRLFAAAAPGFPDATFAQQGLQFTDFYGNKMMDRLTSVLPMPDGRFLAVGYVISPWSDATTQPALARYHPDGSLDRTYGENGSAGGDVAGLDAFVTTDAAIQSDGSVVLVGSGAVVRYTTLHGEGGNDKIFGEDGFDDIFGGAGHDTLDGGAGMDTIVGSDGNDLFLTNDDWNDNVIGGGGSDRADVDEDDQLTSIEELLT